METNVRYTLAGLFVLSMIALIIFSVIWLSSDISTEKYSYYTVYMNESVTGLNQDGPVEYNGVQVGTVDKMEIDKRNTRIVILRLKIKSDTPVTRGTRAKLGIRALSGIAYLLLEDKGTDKNPLVAEKGEPYPVIKTTPSILVRLDTTLAQINNSFSQVSNAVKSLLSKQNVAAISRLLQKLGS